MTPVPSPNFNARAANITLDYVVLHYTGMRSGAEALARLCDPTAEVSAHYMIDEDGATLHLVDEKYRAWHAGKSFWRGIADMNSASIGIELVNPGHEFGYRAFPAAQTQALKLLLRDIFARHSLTADALLAHSDIAPTRKEDPGEFFPWQELAQNGFGLWPVPQPQDYTTTSDPCAMLSAIGYDITTPEKTFMAFQRHYHATNMTGLCDSETAARIRALKRLMDC